MTNHFVCSECGGVSKQAGTCQTDDCIQQGLDLKECHCEDDKHEGVISKWSKDEEDAAPTKTNLIDLDSSAG